MVSRTVFRSAASARAGVLALSTSLLVTLAAPASAFEFADGDIEVHGAAEIQLRTLVNDFDLSDDLDLAQWYNVLNIEAEWDIAEDGWGPFDLVSAFARVEVRYDCVWSRGCGLMPRANVYGDRANHLPKRLVSGRRSGFYNTQQAGDRRRYHGLTRERLDYSFRGDGMGNGREPAHLWMLPGFDTLFNNAGADGQFGSRDDPSLYVFERFLQTSDQRDAYRFAVRRVKGPTGGVGAQILGPWLPRNKIRPIGTLADRANPFRPDDAHPIFTTAADGVSPAPPLVGSGALPFRPVPDLPFGSTKPLAAGARGLFIPNAALLAVLEEGGFDAFDQNFRQEELEWNHGASQQDERELKELYIDLEFFESRLWARIGKQSIVWGKTELFRTTDQFNPQDLALASLPGLEESRIALWSARFVWSFYDVGPLEDVRLEVAFNMDQFEPDDLGRCGEAYTPNPVCSKSFGLFAHGITGTALAGEVRPPNPWNSWKGLEIGARVEFRWDRFSVQISDFYGYGDRPYVSSLFNYARNVDPRTGRIRRAGSTGRCDDGTEPACLEGGNDALRNHAANQQLFAMICANSLFFSAALDPAACGLSILNSRALTSGNVVVEAVNRLLTARGGGNIILVALANPSFVPEFSTAVAASVQVSLNADPGDDPFAPAGSIPQFMSVEQQALLGCGPFFESSCFSDGPDLLNAEASAILQSWPGFEGSGSVSEGDPWDTFDDNRSQPGTIGFDGGPVCTRNENGREYILPGCRGPGDPGYDSAIDGTIAGLLHPFTGQPFKSEMAAASWNALLAFAALSGVGDEDRNPVNIFDPSNPFADGKCSLRRPHLCAAVKNIWDITGVQRNVLRAGGNGVYGRRDFTWHGGAAAVLRYEKRNVLGVSIDFAEDVSKSNWSLEATWIEGVPFADNDDFDRVRRVDTYNLTMSVDRPTFVNFLNENRTIFFNAQVFMQYIRGWETSFPQNGPWNVLATLTANTGYFQDRLLPQLTLVYDVKSNSGGVLWQMTYRMTESFSATIGVLAFYGRYQRKTAPLVPLGPVRNQAGDGAYRSFVENGLSVIRERDEIFLRIRYTF